MLGKDHHLNRMLLLSFKRRQNLKILSQKMVKIVSVWFLWQQVAIMAVGASAIVGWPFAGALG